MNIDVITERTSAGNLRTTSLEYRSRMTIYMAHDHPKPGHARDIERMNRCWWLAHCPRNRNAIQRRRYWLNQAARYAVRGTDHTAVSKWLQNRVAFDDGSDRAYCNRCSNTGMLNCFCGGDFCVCDNNGEYPCPDCGYD